MTIPHPWLLPSKWWRIPSRVNKKLVKVGDFILRVTTTSRLLTLEPSLQWSSWGGEEFCFTPQNVDPAADQWRASAPLYWCLWHEVILTISAVHCYHVPPMTHAHIDDEHERDCWIWTNIHSSTAQHSSGLRRGSSLSHQGEEGPRTPWTWLIDPNRGLHHRCISTQKLVFSRTFTHSADKMLYARRILL